MTQKRTLLAAALVLATTCAACGAGPSMRPDVAVEQLSPGQPAESPAEAPPEPEALAVPTSDLAWAECTDATLGTFGLTSTTPGLTLECAEYEADVDASGQMFGTFAVGALRARLDRTPADAGPLVFTSGSDRSSIATLATMAAGPLSTLLEAHPVVAVDRRGIGRSTAVDCIDDTLQSPTKSAVDALGQFTRSDADAVDRAVDAGRDATIECTDTLQPQELAFGTTYAADDLDRLRQLWGVDRIGVIGSGNGALTALAYAAKFPDNISRLILDSPTGVGADQITLAEQRTQGKEAAFTAFAQRCVALNCSLGSDPTAAVAELLGRAAGGEFSPLSTHEILNGITFALASTAGDASSRATGLSTTLSAAAASDTTALAALAERGRNAYGTDGQFVSRCTDGQQWPSPQGVRDLSSQWNDRYPIYGTDAALTALLCSSWPTAPSIPLPSSLDVPVLVLANAGDPIVGNGGLSSVTGLVGASGAGVASAAWQGSGHPSLGGSQCLQSAAVNYARDTALPTDGTVCPA
ncbi:alpha/beta hydrolase [Rhodococcus sp. ARC_M12]|uniref:alpha/beta fold hydrolase n=1 Tax=Rhodococcus sp. ARC_M12 TaxID=2928854 RepID=UPI001FB52DF3|nr:alpha/beta fold hydrolase [Rhodococcus sp. ARC_M12]MCJ0976281.1 alpha/beta hydrolase [Rhodococcus sp. ARC_M12]